MTALRPSLIAAAVAGEWLRRCADDAPLEGVSIDSREAQHGKLFVALRGDTHDGHDFAGAAVGGGAHVLLVERDVNVSLLSAGVGVLRVENTRAALMQLASWYRSTFTNTTVIAVTGSSGKTTTRQLIHGALGAALPGVASPKSFNNDIGVPLSLLAVRSEHRYAVIEVGINAVGEMQPLADVVRPDVAVITNVGASHLEGLLDVQTVAREKLRLLSTLAPSGLAVLHVDSAALREATIDAECVVWFGESAEAMVRLVERGADAAGSWFALADGVRFRISLPGRHNAVNALAAVAVGRHMGLSDATLSDGLSRVAALPMRMQEQVIHGIRVINDAYNANPASMVAGVETFLELTQDASRRVRVLVLGDMCELGSSGPELHEMVGRRIAVPLAKSQPVEIVCVGALASSSLAAGLAEVLHGPAPRRVAAMSVAAADEIAAIVESGDAVFIKGSRAMALEQLLPAIERRFARTPQLAPPILEMTT